MDEEVWVTIDEAPNYEVSNHYHVRRKASGRPLKPFTPQYRRVVLMVDGARVSFSIDNLVHDYFSDHHIDVNERWRECESAPDYQVSSNGRVRNANTGRILRPYTLPNGRQQVTMMVDGYRLTRPVHLLQEEAFG